MNNWKQEKGAALILSLFIITLFLLFFLTLSTQLINTNKQVNQMDVRLDAQLIAEMGTTYVQQQTKEKQSELEQIINTNYSDLEILEQEIEDVMNTWFNDSSTKRIDSTRYFFISKMNATSTENLIRIEYSSTGYNDTTNVKLDEVMEFTLNKQE